MKKLLLILGVLAPTFAYSQQFSIPWYKISGGGGTSSGGTFSVVGSIGQPDAGMAMSGGNFSVSGGFWSIIAAVETTGSPTLTINVNAPGSAIISWPVSAGNFQLQENSALGTLNWIPVTGATVVGTNYQVTIPTQPGNNFFRLISQ